MKSHPRAANHRDLGSIRQVAEVAWPVVVSMLSYTAMGVADTLVVGWLGVTELAAVGIATTAVFLVNGLFFGVMEGVKVRVAQATGAGRHSAAEHYAWQGLVLAVPFGLTVMAIGCFDRQLFALLGGSVEVQRAARAYFVVRMYGAGFWYAALALSGYFQGIGDTRTPMKVNLAVNALNVVLDVLLVFGWGPVPALGIAGAAWATVFARVAGMVLLGAAFHRKASGISRPDPKALVDILTVGLPMGVRNALHIGGFTAFTAVVARSGEVELAANQVAFKVISLSFLPGAGIAEAATILSGQCIGAREYDAVKRSLVNALALAVSVMAGFGLVFWLAPGWLFGMFTPNPDVIRVGSRLLIVASVFQVFDAVEMVTSGALNGAGDTRFTMWVAIGSAWLVLVPFAWLFGIELGLGALGAWIALTLQIVISSLAVTLRFRAEVWRPAVLAS